LIMLELCVHPRYDAIKQLVLVTVRDGTVGAGASASRSAGLAKTHPRQTRGWISAPILVPAGFRVSAGVARDIIKIHGSINLNVSSK